MLTETENLLVETENLLVETENLLLETENLLVETENIYWLKVKPKTICDWKCIGWNFDTFKQP